MNEKERYQAWTISDEFWEAIKGEIPKKERDPAVEVQYTEDSRSGRQELLYVLGSVRL